MKNILITGVGGDIAQGVATIIRQNRPHCRLVGVDIHPDHGGRLFVDAIEILPRADHPEYLPALKNLIEKESIDTVLPMTEPELEVLNPVMAAMQNVYWIHAGERVVAASIDKLLTSCALEAIGIQGPWTTPAEEGVPDSFPCILKSRRGSGSRAVFVVHDREQADYLLKRHPDAIFQELLEPADREVTCAVFRTRDGRIAVLQMLRRLVGGFTGWAKIIDDEATDNMCRRIAEGLDLRGSINVQLRLTDRGPRVFEINPRFSSTTLMRHQIGFSDVVWALDEAEGKTVTFPAIAPGKILVRVQGAAVIG